jgi:hypothetical protein
MGGGYSGEPISWTRLSEQAGYKIVDCASSLLRKLMFEDFTSYKLGKF